MAHAIFLTAVRSTHPQPGEISGQSFYRFLPTLEAQNVGTSKQDYSSVCIPLPTLQPCYLLFCLQSVREDQRRGRAEQWHAVKHSEAWKGKLHHVTSLLINCWNCLFPSNIQNLCVLTGGANLGKKYRGSGDSNTIM